MSWWCRLEFHKWDRPGNPSYPVARCVKCKRSYCLARRLNKYASFLGYFIGGWIISMALYASFLATILTLIGLGLFKLGLGNWNRSESMERDW